MLGEQEALFAQPASPRWRPRPTSLDSGKCRPTSRCGLLLPRAALGRGGHASVFLAVLILAVLAPASASRGVVTRRTAWLQKGAEAHLVEQQAGGQVDKQRWNLFVNKVKAMKAGTLKREEACGLVKVMLKDRPDLIELFDKWSAPAAGALPAGAVSAAPTQAPAPSASIASAPPAGGLATPFGAAFNLGPPKSSDSPKPPHLRSAPPVATPGAGLGGGFAGLNPGSGPAWGGMASISKGEASTASSSTANALPFPASSLSSFSTAKSLSSVSSTSLSGASAAVRAATVVGGGGAAAAAPTPFAAGTSGSRSMSFMSVSSAGEGGVVGGSVGGEGDDGDTSEGLGPLSEEEVTKLVAKLRALKPPEGPLAPGATKKQQQELLQWLCDAEFGAPGMWSVQQMLQAAELLKQRWPLMKKSNETRLRYAERALHKLPQSPIISAQGDLGLRVLLTDDVSRVAAPSEAVRSMAAHEQSLKELEERASKLAVRNRALAEASKKTKEVCLVLESLAKAPPQHPARRAESAMPGREEAHESERERSSLKQSENACREAVDAVLKAAEETFDAKVDEWLRKGGGNSSKLLHGAEVPRVPLKIHEEQLKQIKEAVSLKVGTLGEAPGLAWGNVGATRPAVGREISNAGLAAALALKAELTQQEWEALGIRDVRHDDYIAVGGVYYKPAGEEPEVPAELRGQQFLQLPLVNAPPTMIFHVSRPCFVYVLREQGQHEGLKGGAAAAAADQGLWEPLLTGTVGKRFTKKEGMCVRVRRSKDDAKKTHQDNDAKNASHVRAQNESKRELCTFDVWKSTSLQGCVILGSSRGMGGDARGGEEARLDGCIVVVTYTDTNNAHDKDGRDACDEVQSDAQMLLRFWFHEEASAPGFKSGEGGGSGQGEFQGVKSDYGNYLRRQDKRPSREQFLPQSAAKRAASATGDGTGSGNAAKVDEPWNLKVSASVRRFVAVAQLIDAYENLNRAECSLEAVPATCVRDECSAVQGAFEARLGAVILDRQRRLGHIWRQCGGLALLESVLGVKSPKALSPPATPAAAANSSPHTTAAAAAAAARSGGGAPPSFAALSTMPSAASNLPSTVSTPPAAHADNSALAVPAAQQQHQQAPPRKEAGKMSDEFKEGVKQLLGEESYKKFTSLALDLKRGRKTVAAVNAEMAALLNKDTNPDLYREFAEWSAAQVPATPTPQGPGA